MQARTQNVSQHVLTRPLPCQCGLNMFLNMSDETIPCQRRNIINLKMCWLYLSHAWKNKKCISTCVEQTNPMPGLTYISTCVEQSPPMPARKRNVSLHVLTKHIQYQQEHKLYLKMFDQPLPMPAMTQNASQHVQARTQNVSQHLLSKALHCTRGHKMHIQMGWTNTSDASGYTKCNLTCVVQTPSMTAWKQNVSQNVFTKPIACQREHKMHLNKSWTNLSLAREDTKCISTYVYQTNSMPARSQIVS